MEHLAKGIIYLAEEMALGYIGWQSFGML